MHIIIHAIINFIFGLILNLNRLEIFALVIGGIIIDIDHIVYMVSRKIYTPKEMLKFHIQESKIMRPHFYFMHFIEPILLLMIIFYFVNILMFYFFLGFLFHWIFDAISYIYFYKSSWPWIKYYSLTKLLINYKKLS
ncbi:MAG: hypothetical protein WC548_04400 [Candidatus Pacearchaeota archaeon]